MDFGLAKRIPRSDEEKEQTITAMLGPEGSTLGTAAYMSPDQLNAEPVDQRSDIFFFGTVLYEMLTGIHPFERKRHEETLTAILRSDPDPLNRYMTEVPEILENTVLKMLVKEPKRRYQSAHEVETDPLVITEETGAIQGGINWKIARKKLPLLATIAIAAFIVLASWYFWSKDSSSPITKISAVYRSQIELPLGTQLTTGILEFGQYLYWLAELSGGLRITLLKAT